MATGYFSEGVCWSLAQEAIDAHFQSIPPSILGTTTTYTIFYAKQSNETWNLVKHTRASNGALTVNYSVSEPNPLFAICELPNDPLTQFEDGTILGWGVATVMIFTYLISRAIRNRG